MTPVEKFSTTTSLRAMSARARSRARLSLRLTVMLRLLGLSSSQARSRKERSGRAADSTLMTSAPNAARIRVQIGPVSTQLKSTTRTPSSGRSALGLPRRGAWVGADIGTTSPIVRWYGLPGILTPPGSISTKKLRAANWGDARRSAAVPSA